MVLPPGSASENLQCGCHQGQGSHFASIFRGVIKIFSVPVVGETVGEVMQAQIGDLRHTPGTWITQPVGAADIVVAMDGRAMRAARSPTSRKYYPRARE